MDEVIEVNPVPQIDRENVGDQLRNILYPAAVILAISMVWAVGWAASFDARIKNNNSALGTNHSLAEKVCSPSETDDITKQFVSAADDQE